MTKIPQRLIQSSHFNQLTATSKGSLGQTKVFSYALLGERVNYVWMYSIYHQFRFVLVNETGIKLNSNDNDKWL